MPRSRRRLLGCLLLVVLVPAALVAAALVAVLTYVFVVAPVDTVGEVRFDRALPVPPLARSSVRDGVRTFTLDAREGGSDLGGSRRTRTWGFDRDVLGPTLRARRGERVRVRVTNHLRETTSVHWHGMHLPARADGGPHQPVRPQRDVVADVDDRPARGDALVPPARPRQHRAARLPRPGRDVPPRRRALVAAGPARRLRRRRRPGGAPGQAGRRRRAARRVPVPAAGHRADR